MRGSHSDGSDQRASIRRCLVPLLGWLNPTLSAFFFGLFVACVPLNLLCNAYKRFKGTGGLERVIGDRLTIEQWKPIRINSKYIFTEKLKCSEQEIAKRKQRNVQEKQFGSLQIYF